MSVKKTMTLVGGKGPGGLRWMRARDDMAFCRAAASPSAAGRAVGTSWPPTTAFRWPVIEWLGFQATAFVQVRSSAGCNLGQLPEGAVLVVGAGSLEAPLAGLLPDVE